MTKTELIRKLSDVTGLYLKDVRAVLEAMTETGPGKGLIATCLRKGERVRPSQCTPNELTPLTMSETPSSAWAICSV